MFQFEYKLTTACQFLKDLAKALGTTTDGKVLKMPAGYASGTFRAAALADGLEIVLANDIVLETDVIFRRLKTGDDMYTLRMEDVDIKTKLEVKLDKEYTAEYPQRRAGIILSSCVYDFEYIIRKNSVFNSANIFISKDWLAKYLHLDNGDDIFGHYLFAQSHRHNMKHFDAEYRNYFTQLLLMEDNENPLYLASLSNRVHLVLEKFFSDLYQKMQEGEKYPDQKISQDELRRLMNVESLLVSNFSKPAPTITELSKIAAMSATNLKKKFKLVYSTSIYDYFQKARMGRAKALMVKGEQSIKDIGIQLGYQNLSNFTIAFKKEFNLLPSQLL